MKSYNEVPLSAGKAALRVYRDHEFGVTNGYANDTAVVSMDLFTNINDCQPVSGRETETKRHTERHTDGRTRIHIGDRGRSPIQSLRAAQIHLRRAHLL